MRGLQFFQVVTGATIRKASLGRGLGCRNMKEPQPTRRQCSMLRILTRIPLPLHILEEEPIEFAFSSNGSVEARCCDAQVRQEFFVNQSLMLSNGPPTIFCDDRRSAGARACQFVDGGFEAPLQKDNFTRTRGSLAQAIPCQRCRMLGQIRLHEFDDRLRHWSVSQISRQQHPRLPRRYRLKVLAKLREQAFPDRCAERCRSLSVD